MEDLTTGMTPATIVREKGKSHPSPSPFASHKQSQNCHWGDSRIKIKTKKKYQCGFLFPYHTLPPGTRGTTMLPPPAPVLA